MDASALILGLTLAVVGIFLYRNYASFLRGAYAKHARVISIQQVFTSKINLQTNVSNYVKNGFYPVIVYRSDGEPVSFTAIDQRVSGNFHVGDEVKLRVLKTRRSKNRVCKTIVVLITMLFLLGFDLFITALMSDAPISLGQVCLASIIVAVSLSTLVLYLKDQDELNESGVTSTKSGRAQLCLAEPAAFKNWTSALTDPAQRYKIRSTQFFGATCMCSSLVVLAVAVQPMANLF
jgi:hypothetical protein